MKKTLVVILSLMLPLVWVWAAGETTENAISSEQEAKWQPVYGPKGDLLNPEPIVSFSRNSTPGNPDPPVIATTLLSEDFEDPTWGDPSTPPPGWTILDNGTEGTQMWYNDDWYKYYYSSWTDTVARIYYSGSAEDFYDEWLISPAIVLPGGATACSLTFKHYYNDRLQPGEDTAYVKITTDDGTTWNDVVVWDEDRTTSPYLENLDITAYDGNTVKIAFVLQANSGAYNDIYEWRIGYMDVWADASNLLNEEFNNWGPGGDNPPTGWTIIDNGVPDTAQTAWNNNDYHDYTRWGSKSARIYYISTYREWQDEWMISPSFAIDALAAYCTLSVVEYYYHSTSTAPWGLEDHGYIKLTTDAGTNWNVIYDNDITKGSSSTANTYKYDLMAYAGNTCQIAFHFVNSPYGSDYWSFDDVAVETLVPLAHDVASTAINSPLMGIEGLDADISVDVTNFGTNTETFDDSTRIWQLNSNTLLYENFSNPQGWTGASPPVNVAGTWAVIDSGDEASPVWNNNDWHGYYYSTWTDTIARVYYYTSPYENMNEWLITPSLNMSSVTNARLTFKHFYNEDTATDTDTGWVLITTDDFATTNTVAMYTTDQGTASAPLNPDYDITAWAAGQANVKIAFKYVGYAGYYWYLDNVEIYEVLTPTLVYSGGENVAALTSFEVRTIDYTNAFTDPDAGNYMLETFTKLGTDEDNSNDSMSSLFTIYPHFDSGGPDGGNYHWVDNLGNGPAYSWIDISSIGTRVDDTLWINSVDDGYVRIPMGMSFTFYDVAYDSMTVSTNGWASPMPWTSSYLSNTYIPNTLNPDGVLAVLWDDQDGGTVGSCYYYYDATENQFIISWVGWPWFPDPTDPHDYQIILDADDRSIKYQYGPGVYQTDITIGIENTDGTIGLEYYYNSNPFGNAPFEGLAITFRYDAPAIDAALASIDEPTDGSVVFNGTTITPTITVLNNSDSNYTIPVTFLITDGTTGDTVYNQSESTALITGGGGTLQHAFTVAWNADPDGDYDMEAYTSLAGDANPANDVATGDFEVATHYSTGGPDEFGYRFIDNQGSGDEYPPEFAWYDLTISPTADTAGTSSGNLGKFPIGFDFDFYGTTFDSLYINGYGYLMFGDTYLSTSSNDCPLPHTTSPYQHMIGIFWDSGYPYGTYDGATIYETAGIMPYRYMVVQYHNHRYSTYYNDMDFEIIIYENGDIVFQYLNVAEDATNYGVGQWATVGIQSDTSGERYGISYLCNDDPLGNRLVDSLAIKWYYQPYAHDVVADEFIQPANSSGLVNVPIDPEVLFTNNGTSDETNVPVRLLIDPGAYNDAQLIAVLDSGTSYAQAFTQFTPTSSGVYTLTAISELVGDEDPGSDTLIMTYTAFDVILDFETSKNGLAGGGDWEWGVPNNPEGPANAYSGVNLWATNLSGDYTAGLHTLEFELILGSSAPAIGIASWYDTELSYDGGNFAVSTDSGATWNVITPDIGYSGTANSSHPLTGDPIFTGHNQKFWETANFDLSAYAGDTVFVRFAFGADGSVFYPGWHIDDMALADATLLAPDMDVTPLTITGEADPGLADYDTITVSNSGDATLIFTAAAYMDETFTNALGQREQFYALDEQLNIRRGRSAFTPIDNSSIAERQQLEGTKTPNADKANEGIYVPTSYIAPQNPLPIIAVDIAYENFDDGLLPAGWSIIDGGSTIDTWMPQSTNTCTRTGTYLFNDWFTVDSDCALATDTLDEQLLTGYYDLSSYSQVNLAFGSNFQKYATYGDSGYVEVRNGSTGAWSLINLFDADLQSYEDFDITSLIPTRDSVQIRFRYTDRGDDCWYWMIDDFLLYEPDTPWLMIDTFGGSIPPLGAAIDIEVALDAEDIGPGIYTGRVEIISNDIDVDIPVTFIVGGLGTIAGQVTDANDASPIEGAVVTATLVSATTVVDTTDVSGNYSIDITPGTVNVTVEAVGYVTDSQNVVVVEDQTTTHNVALGSPIALIDISPVVDTVGLGDTSMYDRYLYNTGTAPLEYTVSINFSPEPLLAGFNIRTDVVSEKIANIVIPNGNADIAPFKYSHGGGSVILDFADTVFFFDPQLLNNDTHNLGVEFDGEYFWVTGGNSGSSPDKLYKFSADGSTLIATYDQSSAAGWGWRDLAWDGDYLYASDSYDVIQIDPATGLATGSTIPGPITPCRALAYDPATGNFWTASFSSSIYEFNAGGTVNTYANSNAIYGMAWDDASEDGPWLWVYSQDGAEPIESLISQFDPASGTYTGISFSEVLPPGYDSTVAGGACFATDHPATPGLGVIFTLNQGYPRDYVMGYEITVTETWLSVASGGSGSVAPDDSAEIVFMVDFRGPDIVVDSTYQADANINNNSTAPTPVIPFSITAIGGSLAGTVTDSNTTSPIEGAVVTASSDDEAIIVDTTDASGNYSIDIAPGPMTVTVEADGYVTDINQVIVFQNQTTTHNVVLDAPIATIDTSPVVDTVTIGDTALYSMFLFNTGSAPLDYDVTLEDTGGVPALLNVNANFINEKAANSADPKLNNEVASLTFNKEPLPVILDVTWMTVTSGQTGTVVPGDSAEIVFMVDFRDTTIVADSTYEADANINNNDPYSTPVIRFSITAEAAGCPHVVGDVNGSDSYNGLDITYGVAFFKGGNDPLCPDCPIGDCNAWHYCGDVNGSCSYNGLDITYGVAYFKGGADPIFCADCPPIVGPTVTIQDKELKPAEQPAVESKSKSKKESSLKR